ncbi:hypothetical protein [Amycolatopsis cihanbeyliensis]|uniref:Uncharacterized protein n=1 Tax=Amycolatopsis cihanbeyliensis TaxID=1128664 RepID=A0A542DGS3_AMYCI|nr:hypothetical protein [Amycolatopsis cihanbeyliensis]TQJ02287.1 hypothetical protein FB471_2010 [Amycolatopsis cihanbeyliensis]
MSSTTPPARFLEQARAALRGKHAIPARQVPRAAALLARQALEARGVEICCAHGAELRAATMRSRLVVLRKVAGDKAGDLAGVAWSGLSRSCHHHAYELSPTSGEVGYLIDNVAQLLPAAQDP